MNGLIKELQRRNVFRVGVAYLALAWLVIQVTDMAVPALNLPDTLNSIVFYIGVIGFPFALFFAWAFELTPEGLRRSEDVPEEESIRPDTGRNLERLALFFAVCALGFVVWDAYLKDDTRSLPTTETTGSTEAFEQTMEEPEARSIAVLPFVNMSDDKDYFADGLSEELLNLLAKIPDLQVTGRTSSFAFKGKNVDLREIGDTLGVSTILEGSVRRSGDTIRVTAQLINVADGFHIWSETYDRALTDIFVIQDEISGQITRALKVHLNSSDPRHDLPTENMEAYALYLEAKPRMGIPTELFEAERMLIRATSLDPDFVEAWIDLHSVTHNLESYGIRAPEDRPRPVIDLHDRLQTLAPGHPKVMLHMALGQSWRERWGFPRFMQYLADFIAEHPQVSEAYDLYSFFSLSLGQYSQVEQIAKDLALRDPLYFENGSERAMALFSRDRGDEAEAILVRWGDTIGMPQVRMALALFDLIEGNESAANLRLEDYSRISGADMASLRSMLKGMVDPATRESAIDSAAWREHFAMPMASEPRNRGITYIFLNDPQFWELFGKRAESGDYDFQLIAFLMGNYRFHNLMETEQYREQAETIGLVKYWREVAPPEFCNMGHESWMCDLQ